MTFSDSDQQLDDARRLVAGASCWVLSDGKAGDEAQCLGVVERLQLHPEIRVVKPRSPFTWLMPWGPIDPAEGFAKPQSPIAPPYPDIVIASGRRTVSYLRAIKRAAGPAVLTVYLKDPRTGAATADVIWVPSHDRLRGANVIVTLPSPHRISPERLREAGTVRPVWAAKSGGSLIGVMLGGDSQHHRF